MAAGLNPVIGYFKRVFAYTPPFIVRAPGRLELLGNHTDYNEGLVMSLAVDKALYLAFGPRTDGKIEIASHELQQKERFTLSALQKNPAAPWADYVKGVLQQLRLRGVHFSGFNAAIQSTIPIGAGMSSSAALSVATALAVRRMYPFILTETGVRSVKRSKRGEVPAPTLHERLQLARVCQAAERTFVGVNCGILDPISCLFGKEFQALAIDCRFSTVQRLPMIGPVSVVVCNSGGQHSLVSGGYNELRALCESAARKLGARALRSVDLRTLKASRSRLNEREYQCAYHVVGEIQRVVFAERALEHNDLEQFGQYMFQSHESSRDLLQNSCPELDLLVELARNQRGCLGARLTGGGFGGATINLVLHTDLKHFVSAMAAGYEQRTGRKMEPIICQIANGAG